MLHIPNNSNTQNIVFIIYFCLLRIYEVYHTLWWGFCEY